MDKIDKAINHLKLIQKLDTKKKKDIYDLAILSLERQIPKKSTYHHKEDGECALTICPNCENRLTVESYAFPLDRYCKECGQHYVANIKDWTIEE